MRLVRGTAARHMKEDMEWWHSLIPGGSVLEGR